MTRVQGVHFIEAKYAAATLISSSVMAFARPAITGVLGFRGSAEVRASFLKSSSWRRK
jgi:hypothetical protein